MSTHYFLLLLLLLPISINSCSPYNLSCGNYTLQIQHPFYSNSNPNPNCSSLYLIQCMNLVPVIQLHGQAFFYPVSNISYTNKTLIIHDLKLSSFFRGSNCVFLYDFRRPIPNFNVSNFTENLNSSFRFFDCDEVKSCHISNGVFGDEIYELYYGDDDLEGNRGFGYCGRARYLWFDWRLSFDGKDGFFSLLSAGFSRKRSNFPECFDCRIEAGNCSSKHCRGLKSSGGGGGGHNKKIITGLCVGFASFLIRCFLFILRHNKISETLSRDKKARHGKTIEAFLEKHGSLATKRYTYSDVKKMTKSFGEKLGQGGYGSVYKGKLFDGDPVAVKILCETKSNGEDFINEVAAIGNTCHVNVISLRGFCVERSKRALIYDFMPNGSLDMYIYSEKLVTKTSLGWEKLYEIAIGIARGLEYLHRGSNTRIVHFDIKPHNILLDQDFCPKISDFGMAKLCPPKQSILSM